MDGHFGRRSDTKPHPFAMNFDDGDGDPVADNDRFTKFSA